LGLFLFRWSLFVLPPQMTSNIVLQKNVFLEFVAKLWFLLPVEFFKYKQDTKCSSLGAERVWPWSIVFYPQHFSFVFLNTTFFFQCFVLLL
jgi:hypothetical protein